MFKDKKFLWILFISILVVILEILSLADIMLPPYLNIPLLALIILGIGHATLWHGLKSLLTLNFKNINALMLIAVMGAFYLEQYEEAAVVIALYTLAEKLEDIGIAYSKSALDGLIAKMPKTVLIKGMENPIAIEEAKIGDRMLIKPFSMIPLDGKILTGTSYVDESTITGEPIPQDKFIGDKIYAGTLNKQGYLEAEIVKTSKDTTFAKINELMFNATKTKAQTQKFIESFSKIYTPLVILLSFLLIIIPPLLFGESFNLWLLKGISLLVIACPCALVIATPISIYSSIGNASKKGALIKGGRYLEAIGQIDVFALDKTRTLTYGEPIVTDILTFGNVTKDELLACAAGIEIFSEHPLAQSIVNAAKEGKLTPHDVENFQSLVGKGVKADCLVCEDKHHCIGKLPFILEEHEIPQEIVDKVEELQLQGKTSIVIATHGEVEGIIAVSDRIREESQALINGLKNLKIKPIMLTGDNLPGAKIIAENLGINQIKANLLPEDKANIVKKLITEGKMVAMVGDGVNDAPALALSNVGITIGSLGNDMALEAASIVVLNDRLDIIPFLVRLGRKAIRTIQFNSALAIAVKLLFIILAIVGITGLAAAIFADVGVTIIVMLISLRLLNYT
ncbi:putative cadmium-transporting ATPase [Candidatus Rubidus massiliensis]|nr:MAG: ATPase [Chlamydia sp. 32-24]CDZ80890.1 putative cadmium-transporting ATPase [Candidatus Rubidus massiliensis]